MPTFNGETLIITLDSGVTTLEWIDVYSAWKDWMIESPLNRKYPTAFRSDGGNPLSAIINQGSYFFLNNSGGWRIKPPEEDITIYVTGNLAVEDTSLPALTPTDGAYTAAIFGLQSITQGITPVMGEQLTFMNKIIKNKKSLVKNGSVWELIIYDTDDITPIFNKALKDKDGNNITDLTAGVLAEELQSSV